VGNEKDLQDILTENGFHSILYYASDQKIKKINCNPLLLNKRKLNKDLDEYIKKNLTSIDEYSLNNLLTTKYNKSLETNKDDPNRYIALLEIALATDDYKKKLQSETKLHPILENTSYPKGTLYKVAMKTTICDRRLLILTQNIGSLKSSYKNDDLKNDIDDIFNIAFSTITSLASSLLCCLPEETPKTKITKTSSSPMFTKKKFVRHN
jgi:hypothetical protein